MARPIDCMLYKLCLFLTGSHCWATSWIEHTFFETASKKGEYKIFRKRVNFDLGALKLHLILDIDYWYWYYIDTDVVVFIEQVFVEERIHSGKAHCRIIIHTKMRSVEGMFFIFTNTMIL